jgi:tetratricopeptide (TPR) repeat protein
VAGPRAPARALLLTWLAYYLALLVIVFHTQVRYRTAFTPFLFACAAGGAGVLAAPRRRAWLGLLAGVVLVGWAGAGHVTAANRAISSAWTLRAARSALDRGDTTGAAALVERAASKDAGAARPFTGHGRWLAEAGRADEAAAAYQQALAVKPGAWLPLVVLPRLLADAGRGEDAARALALAHAFSHEANAWQALEAAWRELPAPRATEVSLGAADYGAVRGFMAPGAAGRWSRARAWLRLRPPEPADLYEVTIEMGSPEPSPLAAPEVQLRAGDGGWRRVSLDRQARPFVLRARPGKDGAVVVELRAPAWTRRGSAPELGVLVRRFAAARAGA